MARTLMSYGYLCRSAAETRETTISHLAGVAEHYPKTLDVMLRLPYFTGHPAPAPNPDTPDAEYLWWCLDHYVGLGYSCSALFGLWQRGFYAEAAVVLRQVLEVFVQLRYFNERRSELRAHLTNVRRVRFRKMFDALSPGYYEKYYGQMLSGVAHGGLPSAALRLDLNKPGYSPGCKYDEQTATWVLNQLTPLLFGLLHFFPIFFPGFEGAADDETQRLRGSAMAWLSRVMRNHSETHPASRTWFERIGALIGWVPDQPNKGTE